MFCLSKYFHSAVILAMRPADVWVVLLYFIYKVTTLRPRATAGDCGEEELKTTNKTKNKLWKRGAKFNDMQQWH